jgi:division protein CdvB (Snf7/Vps24/ESCRT-III family)
MPRSDFTKAEQQLLRLSALCFSNSQIAEELKISVPEVSPKFDRIASKIMRIDGSISLMKETLITRDSIKTFSTELSREFFTTTDERNQLGKSKKIIAKKQDNRGGKSLIESEPIQEVDPLDSYKKLRFIINLVRKSTLTLRIQQNKLEKESFRLKEQDRMLFETCMDKLKKNNAAEATKLATEIAEVRKLVKLFYNVQLAIVRVILRIEEHNCKDTFSHIESSVKLLRDISQEIAEIQPDISEELKTICQVLMVICNQECL